MDSKRIWGPQAPIGSTWGWSDSIKKIYINKKTTATVIESYLYFYIQIVRTSAPVMTKRLQMFGALSSFTR